MATKVAWYDGMTGSILYSELLLKNKDQHKEGLTCYARFAETATPARVSHVRFIRLEQQPT